MSYHTFSRKDDASLVLQRVIRNQNHSPIKGRRKQKNTQLKDFGSYPNLKIKDAL